MNTRSKTLLIVESNAPTVRTLTGFFRDGGRYYILTAHDSKRALDILESIRVHLVILSLLPLDGNGVWLYEQIKAGPETGGIPVLVISGGSDGADSAEERFDFVVREPVELEYLNDLVARILGSNGHPAAHT